METINNLGALLPINESNGQRAVNARDLHFFLESKQDFSTWMKNRIEQYGFVENQDYQVFHKIMENPKGGRPLDEYALSIDMAKELSMVERSEKGKQARRYFIACEKGLVQMVSIAPQPKEKISRKELMDAATWAAKFLNLNDASKLLMAQQILAPTGLILPEYTNSKGFLLSADKLLKSNGVNMDSHKFNLMLQEKGYVTYRERPSKSKGTKRFPVLTAKGLKYGENQVHPKNQAETQIRYYEDKFLELLKELGLK